MLLNIVENGEGVEDFVFELNVFGGIEDYFIYIDWVDVIGLENLDMRNVLELLKRYDYYCMLEWGEVLVFKFKVLVG